MTRSKNLLAAAPGAALVVVVAALLWHTFLGDPSIYLPFARNLAHGEFFRFNPGGEFSTGIASPIWTCLLAIPFALGFGVMSVKALALVVAILAVIVAVAAARAVSGSALMAALGGLFVATHLAYWGVTAYDSAVAVALVALAVLAGIQLQRSRDENGAVDARAAWTLAIVWGLLPLGRADLAILIPLQAAALYLGGVIRSWRDVRALLVPVTVAMLPALAYYAAAFIDTGSYSVSSATRTYDQKLEADKLGPLAYSSESVAFLRSISYALVAALAGSYVLARRPATRWVGIFCAAGIVAYALLLVFFPVTFYIERYSLPAVTLIGIGIASALAALPRRPLGIALLGVIVLLSLKAVRDPIDTARAQRAKDYSFAEISEKEVADKIAAVAPKGATVLGYEVQDRWMLRDDTKLLALNGIIDGHVFDYRDRGDMRGFLLRYKPRYWIANDPVLTLPYLRDSLLGDAYRRFKAGETAVALQDIRFRVIAKRGRPVPAGFAGWRYLVEFEFPSSASTARQ